VADRRHLPDLLPQLRRQQPGLDWRNPEVETVVFDVVRFWLDRGVDGSRIDVARRIMKDPELHDNAPRRGNELEGMEGLPGDQRLAKGGVPGGWRQLDQATPDWTEARRWPAPRLDPPNETPNNRTGAHGPGGAMSLTKQRQIAQPTPWERTSDPEGESPCGEWGAPFR
jgi:hypothetical protein